MSFADIVGKTKGTYHFINRLFPKNRDPNITNPALLPFSVSAGALRLCSSYRSISFASSHMVVKPL